MTADVGPRPPQGRLSATPGLSLPFIPSPDPSVDIRDFPYLLAQLQLMGYQSPFEVIPASATAHEGHGGPGATVQLQARLLPLYVPIVSPRTGLPIVLPAPQSPLHVTWRSPNEGVLTSHGTMDRPMGVPAVTDATGAVTLGYTPKEESGDQSGPLEAEVAMVMAEVPLWDLLASRYLLSPALRGFVHGTRSVFSTLTIEWHSEGDYHIDGTYQNPFATGTAHGEKCDGFDGDWIIDGTYTAAGMFRGTQRWVITVTEAAMAGTFTYTDHQLGVVPGAPETEGQAAGTVTVAEDELGDVHMHLTETSHSFRTKTTAPTGGYGNAVDAPLEEYDFIWDLGDPC
jgi:hypothetical protein